MSNAQLFHAMNVYGLQEITTVGDEFENEDNYVKEVLKGMADGASSGLETRYAPNERVCGIYRYCVDPIAELHMIRWVTRAVAQRWVPADPFDSVLSEVGVESELGENEIHGCRDKLRDLRLYMSGYLDRISIRLGLFEIPADSLQLPALLDSDSSSHEFDVQALKEWALKVFGWLDDCYILSVRMQGLAPLHPRYRDMNGWFRTYMVALGRVRRHGLSKCKKFIRAQKVIVTSSQQKMKEALLEHEARGPVHLTRESMDAVYSIIREVWLKVVRLGVDLLNRMCRYYHPIISEQSVVYISQCISQRAPEHRCSKQDVHTILETCVPELLRTLSCKSDDPGNTNVNEKLEALSLFRGFNSIFFTQGMFHLIRDSDKPEVHALLCNKVAPYDHKGIDTIHKALKYGGHTMAVLHRGRELIHQFSESDIRAWCAQAGSDSTRPLSCCLEPALADSNIYLKDIPFLVMRKCIPLEVATE